MIIIITYFCLKKDTMLSVLLEEIVAYYTPLKSALAAKGPVVTNSPVKEGVEV